MADNCGVYKITNVANGKFYIGSSVNIKSRLYRHRWMLVNNTHDNCHLQAAYNKYGADSFTFETILLCDESMTLYCEQEILEQWKPAYNIATCAEAPGQGMRHTDKARAKISAAGMGNTNCLGHTLTEEHKRKISAAKMGRTVTEETIALISAANKGELNPNFGKVASPETRVKLSEANKGKHPSAETLVLMCAAQKRRQAACRLIATGGTL